MLSILLFVYSLFLDALEKKKSVQFDDKVKIETIEKQPFVKHTPSIDMVSLNFEVLQPRNVLTSLFFQPTVFLGLLEI